MQGLEARLFREQPPPTQLGRTILDYIHGNPRRQTQLSYVTAYNPGKWLLERELSCRKSNDTAAARASWPHPQVPGEDVYAAAAREQLTGLAFSGGGIRSATFCLGVLQTLAELGLLDHLDYLSSVSGGGYIHQWFASWVYRARGGLREVQPLLIPLPKAGSPARSPEPIFWLRRYSAYLTPQRGILSADTWTMISIWFRNTTLNQIVLFAFLSFLLLAIRSAAHPLLTFHPTQLPGLAAADTLITLASALLLGGALYGMTATVPDPTTRPPGSLTTSQVMFFLVLPGFANAFVFALWIRRFTSGSLALPLLLWGGSLLLLLLVLTFGGRSVQGFNDLHPQQPWSIRFVVGGGFLFAAVLSAGLATGLVRLTAPHLVTATDGFTNRVKTAFTPYTKPIKTQQHLVQSNTDGSTLNLHLETSTPQPALQPPPSSHLDPGALFAILAPPFFFFCIFLAINLQLGLLGRYFLESRREWVARFRGLGAMVCLGWIVLTSIAYLGPVLVAWVLHASPVLKASSILAFVATHALTLYSGASSKTDGKPSPGSFFGYRPLDLVGIVGSPIAILLLLVVDAYLLDVVLALKIDPCKLPLGSHFTVPWLLGGGIVFALLLFGWRVDVNEFSMHGFYRNRLARAYLGATNPKRSPDPFTGFDDHTETIAGNTDMTVAVADLCPERFSPRHWMPATIVAQPAPSAHPAASAPPAIPAVTAPPAPAPKLPCAYTGPFPIFSSTLTLTFGDDLAYHERKGTSFAFTPLYTGYHVGWTGASTPTTKTELNGFVRTHDYAYQNRGIQLATAAAISGAAISPNQGFSTQPALAFLMTLFNVRLAWWIANPRRPAIWPRYANTPTPNLSLLYLVRELFGQADDTSNYVSLCDGGKFENMGLYELVRRRCRFIIVCDAEQDTGMTFEGIGSAIRKCRMDFGVEIDLDLRPLQLRRNGFSGSHFQVGTITYPPPPGGGLPGQLSKDYVERDHPYSGRIIYLKTSLVGDEPGDLLHYKNSHPGFPQDTTLNQWFTESQFESYRRLGQLSAEEALQKLANPKDRDDLAQKFSAIPSVPAHPPSRA